MNENSKKKLTTKLFKILCWRQEKKHWLVLYDELILLILSSNIDDELKGKLLLECCPLKFFEFNTFRQKIFEVIDYVDRL